MSSTVTLADALAPLRSDPAHAAVLFDVDGTLAPIVRHAGDAVVPEATRGRLIEVARSYGLVACVSGRRASEARRIVSIGSIAYIGSHGAEILHPGRIRPELDPDVAAWAPRVQEFARAADTRLRQRLRVRFEDKGPIAAFHWRGAPDEEAAEAAVHELAQGAEEAGLAVHWGRKVLELRPPVHFDKGKAIVALLAESDARAALYVGDDNTDLDAFRGLTELAESGRLDTALLVGVRSDEGPSELEASAGLMVDGPQGVHALLVALLAT